MSELKNYLEVHRERFIQELFELLRIPSVSNNPDHHADMQRTAELLRKYLDEAGADFVEVFPTAGHPIVFARRMVSDDLPTIMVYGHYDVQPADPIALWDNPPFDPVIKNTDLHPNGAIFARGSCDDKGQLFMHIKAFEFMNSLGKLPCNVKFLLEGEEEIGSVHLEDFCRENRNILHSDVILISDTSILSNDIPSITMALRGLSSVEVEVKGPDKDLHSGTYGGGVANPINVLCRMIAAMKDTKNKITIPGFYDDVLELTDEDRKKLNQVPLDLEKFKKNLGIRAVEGEEGYTTLERVTIRPTLDVNGIWGGYIGTGGKTVIPSKAFAKISMRLVPNQDPEKILTLFQDYFQKLAPGSVSVKVRSGHGGHPVITPTQSPEYKAAELAMIDSFGVTPVPQWSGGSIPIVPLFEEILGVKSVLMGFGLDTDDIHSPNEHFGLFNLFKGIETIPLYFKNYAQLKYQEAENEILS